MPYRSCLDEWKSSMMWLQDHPNIFPDRTVPLDSPLSPWNSREVIQQLIYEDAQRMISTTRRHALIDRGLGGHQSMDRTWPDDGAQIRNTAHGQWYDDNQFPDQKSDEDFFREIRVYTLYGPNLTLSIDPYNPVSKALLQGTAQIIRATDVPGFRNFQGRHTTYTYDSTANRYEWAGTMVESYNNGPRILEDVKKKNPTMEVVLVYGDDFTHDDAAFILYPKTSSAAQ
ncbi:hypothetical protein SAMN05216360_101215 [Methylobacterium phyllostachyos]|uniref:Uncharacterized protein n=2 Tax=Methylobacterium phyllostachyos TaxID=582672 RepID=A0A1G9RDE4_9HYPH|nr:hypothetical protein SAMN05216360_101215 [Methylobacterium phyllostachyos]